MRIGVVTTWFERGAAYVSRQYRDVLRASEEVFIYARGGEAYAIGDPRWDEPRVTWGKKSFLPLPTAIDLRHFEDWIRTNGIELVFFNEQFWWEPVLQCRRMGVITGSYIDYYTEQTVPFFGCYDFLICNTRRHHSVFNWHPQCFYLPWGTDTELFTLRTPGAAVPGVVTFFHSGGVNPYRKGCDLAIEAFARLDGPARFVIHTQRPLKAVFPNLAPLIAKLTAAGRLECIEETVGGPGLFHLGDIYVYPTRLEGIGLTILEAGSCGLPCIVTGGAPMTEFVEHGSNGRHVAVARYVARFDGYYWPQAIADVGDLTAQMQWYVEHQESLWRLKRRARDHAEQHFSWAKNAKDLSALFRSVRKRQLADTQEIADQTAAFERARYARHKLSPYMHARAWIEHRYPRLFRTMATLRSATALSFARQHVQEKP